MIDGSTVNMTAINKGDICFTALSPCPRKRYASP
jgi:hypothetical protein